MQRILVGLLCLSVRLATAQQAGGSVVFEEHCARCHKAAGLDTRAPSRDSLREHTPESILEVMTSGAMEQQARALTVEQRRQVAEFIAARPFGASAPGNAPATPNSCDAQRAAEFADPTKGPMWNGWGADLGNSRFQSAAAAGLTADQVPKLKLKWAFGIPNATSMYGQPSIVGGRIYVGANTGEMYSLDAKTGCMYWSFQAVAGVRTAPSIGQVGRDTFAVYFGDLKANVYAVDAKTGKQIWTQLADTHPIARITGAPTLAEGRLYVPVASLEELAGGNPAYECCTFRGSIIAYNAETGKQIWRSYTIPQEPQRIRKTSRGTQLRGPAGAAVWSAPTLDLKHGVLYAATGDGYTAPAAPTTDAIMAFDLKTGRVIWTKQLTENDAFVVCDPNAQTRSETCPPELGPDFDFASSPILRTLPNGHDILAIGQKSSVGWGLDPERQGAVLWQHRVGKGSTLGGIEFGSASDGRLVYFANADAGWGPEQAGGLAAVDIQSGEQVWFTRPPPVPCQNNDKRTCIQAQAAAITAIPGAVFSASTNGIMRAYSSADGRIIWEYNSVREYPTVNGVPAKGGAINGPGPTVVGGMLFWTSGYTEMGAGPAGNVLLAFGIE
jgi:polyvinyl alcohol dehydrogenase (cytochrome)